MSIARYVVPFIALGFVACLLATANAAVTGKRPHRVTDGGALEDINTNTIAIASDGEAVALVRMRPKNSQAVNSIVISETRADVWLQERRGRPLRNLTNGQTDASGWWAPDWSPDGQRLAMLSSRGGNVTLWVWERAADQLRQVSPLNIDFSESGGLKWLDADRVAVLALPAGETSTPVGIGKYAEFTVAAWEQARRGEVTASPISSLRFPIPERRLVVIDLRDGSPTEIATTQLANFEGAWVRSWWVSPEARAVVSRRSVPARRPLYGDAILRYPASIQLHWLDGQAVRLSSELPDNVITETIRWSADGKEVAFFAYGDRPINPMFVYREGAMDVIQTPQERTAPMLKHPARLYRVNIDAGEAAEWATGDIGIDPTGEEIIAFVNPDHRIFGSTPLDLPPFTWTERGELLFKEVRGAKAGTWSVLGRDGRSRAGDEQMQAGFAKEAALREARERFEQATKRPMESAKLVAFSTETQSGLYYDRNIRGQFLWRVSRGGAIEELAAMNRFRENVNRGTPRLIEYTTSDGVQAKAYLLLPPGYVAGRRYPLVVDSDIGYEDEHIERSYREAISGERAEGQDLAAGGYVYMFASMPTRGMDRAGRANLLLFTHGILPAVDKAVALGIADADRVFLYGESSMGYGVYALVTQTARFKAAVAQCGYTDSIIFSLLGADMRRYAPWRFADVRVFPNYSSFFLPFWRNEAHLRRNSPLSYVDRVQTPLMIIHGDLDVVSMASAEMFFAALIQQRKPAEFVRYWGEGHGILNPKNYADYHQRMFAWYDDWGDISRDIRGQMIFEGDRVKSRGGKPALSAGDYAKFEAFGPGGE